MSKMVKVLQQMSGTRNGVPWPERGETMEVSDEEAAQLCLGQTPIAELVPDKVVRAQEPEGDKDPETAPEGGEPETKTVKPATARPSAARASTAKK